MMLVLLLVSTGCGGGGGNSDNNGNDGGDTPPPMEDPFGLTERESLATFDLPTDSGTIGSYQLVERFPDLSFSSATFVSGIPGDDRLAVMEQAGLIRVFDDDPAVTSTRTVLDLSGEVLFAGEQGLLGLAFDPDFVDNRYLYVHYSLDGPRRSVIARFTWDTDTDLVDPASRKLLLTLAQPFSNHNGGMLAFGPDDDYLYIAFGDGGSGGDPENRAQDLGNLFGTLLRIDVHPEDTADPYDVPADNPYVDDPDARDEIWAHGLRNPFRFSFDRTTGTLWLGDVGQGSQEEIDIVTRGGNYGWRVYEGDAEFDASDNNLPRSAFTFPIHTYENSGGAAVIGGYVYRGLDVPSLWGRYLYADFVTGEVWALAYDGSTVTANDLIATTTAPTSFGEDNNGEVYLVTQGSGIFAFEETSGGGSDVPGLLSETGLFSDLGALSPAPGLIEYELNEAFWSDGTVKRRWIGIPDDQGITFAATGAWEFPAGTVIIKHFELALVEGDPASQRRLETRVLTSTGSGWQGFTYRWNDQETDAELVTGGDSELITVETASGAREQLYEYPSPTDCLRCHTQAAGFVLGVKTRQLNRDFLYAGSNVTDNQLRAMNHVSLFTTDIGEADQYQQFPAVEDAGEPLSERARTYLDVNCAQCHQPGGPTQVDIDLRFDTADLDMNAIDELPQQGGLGAADPRIIAPGARERSVLWLRMQSLDDERMPPLSSHVVDETGLAVIGDWIDSM
jgi:uncharacterized repeat protein (TIGR03806 family)